MIAQKNQHLTYKALTDLPRGVRQCRRCLVLIGRGYQAAAKSNPRICHWCESEENTKEVDSAGILGITEERVRQWAEWRREGKTYAWITEFDDYGPALATIKAHLKQQGYTYDGDLIKEK